MPQTAGGVSGWPALVVAAGVLLGALLIGWAAYRGIPHWQSIPSTWDAVWHANEVRFILDTGQASPTHMGELRNVETHEAAVLPVGVPRPGRGVLPAHRRGAHHRLHAELAGGLDLAVPGQRRDADLASAAPRDHDVAHRRRGGDRGGAVGVVHLGALRRVRHRVDAQPGGLRGRGADHLS